MCINVCAIWVILEFFVRSAATASTWRMKCVIHRPALRVASLKTVRDTVIAFYKVTPSNANANPVTRARNVSCVLTDIECHWVFAWRTNAASLTAVAAGRAGCAIINLFVRVILVTQGRNANCAMNHSTLISVEFVTETTAPRTNKRPKIVTAMVNVN